MGIILSALLLFVVSGLIFSVGFLLRRKGSENHQYAFMVAIMFFSLALTFLLWFVLGFR